MRLRPVLGLSGAGLALLVLLPALAGSGGEEPANLLQTFDLAPVAQGAGGLSALWLAADGGEIVLLSDRGLILRGQILRDASGAIHDLRLDPALPLRTSRKAPPDSEGIARGADGFFYISTEGPARVWRLGDLDEEATAIARPEDFGSLPPNGALEALAVDGEGRLYTLPETAAAGGGFPVIRSEGAGTWAPWAEVAAQDGFRPVGADIGPDGRLYLLWRAFGPISGFASRLTRHEMTGTGPGPAEVLIDSPYGMLGNLEGVAIWRDGQGSLRATLVSDDNGNPFQTSQLVELRLPD